MKIYTTDLDKKTLNTVVVDDMILTKDMPTAAGSKMLDGYMSLFDAQVVTRLVDGGFVLGGKADVGEFGIDLLGETSHNGACIVEGMVINPSAEILKKGEAKATINLDVNGSVRRAAAQNNLVSIKPTYGTVSRYGTIPVACSGETVSIMATNVNDCRDVLDVISGHDDKDGTSLSDEYCSRLKKNAEVSAIKNVAVIKNMKDGIDSKVTEKINNFVGMLKNSGVNVCEIENSIIPSSRVAWNILMSSELCNNVSRYDGIKYGYRSKNFSNIDELYTNSRTEAFGELIKATILYGSDNLSTENYMKVYDKALRIRRVIVEEFKKIFEKFDAVIMPACSTMEYNQEMIKEDKYIAFKENFYTAPASITGLPVVTVNGVQLMGREFSENALLNIAQICEKEGE